MMTRRGLGVLLVLVAFGAGGCQSGGRTVTLTVEHTGTDRQPAAPVASAHIRAVALDTNDVPLPVSLENLSKLDRKVVSGLTDAKGRVRLSLRPEGVYLVEVNGPPFGPLAEAGPWKWKLSAESEALTPVGPPQNEVALLTGRPAN